MIRVGHVHFMLFMQLFFVEYAKITQHERRFWLYMDLLFQSLFFTRKFDLQYASIDARYKEDHYAFDINKYNKYDAVSTPL